jgi:hypothetical protein
MPKQQTELTDNTFKILKGSPNLSSKEMQDMIAAQLVLSKEIDKGWSGPVSSRTVQDIIAAKNHMYT